MSTRLLLPLAALTALAGCSQGERTAYTAVNTMGNAVAATQATWDRTATEYRDRAGSRFTFACPAGGTAHTVWGTGVYTDDSSVCTAAVHAGAITFAQGGRVTIEMRPGQGSYSGSAANGVRTEDYGAWGGSFVIVR